MKSWIFWILAGWFSLVACGEEEATEPDDGLVFNVPRDGSTSGPSILSDPTADRGGFAGACPKMQVFCNGMCLSVQGEQAGNCTLLQPNIGEAGEIAVDSTDLYYTAMKSEILKMRLVDGIHQSLVTAVQNPTALYPTPEGLYFGNNPSSTETFSDVRLIATGSASVTVLTEHVGTVFDMYRSGDSMILGAGAFAKGPIYSFPPSGGRWKEFAAKEILHLQVVGDTIYFSMNSGSEAGLYSTSLGSPDTYLQLTNGDPTGTDISDFFVENGFIYWFALKARNTARMYTRIPVSGGPKQDIQTAGSGVLLAHNAALTFYADTVTGESASNIMSMPLGGGQAVVLGTYESGEIKRAVADASHLYVSVGNGRTGGILRFDL